jgi:lysophospholipase L1-like esterase
MKLRLFVFVAVSVSCAAAAPQAEPTWIGSWATSQQVPEPQNAVPLDQLQDATLREIIHLSIGGQRLRVHISNAFGTAPLHLTSAHIARPVSTASAAIDPASDRELMFHGAKDVIVPAGAELISDPLDSPVAPLTSLSVSIHYDQPPTGETGHPGSRATSYLVHGDLVTATDLPSARKIDHWYQLSGVDVQSSASDAASIVTLGDSITDGHGATTNGNDRWTDDLARRLQNSTSGRNVSVLNQGIGGNHLLTDGLGPNALARFDRDVLGQPGVRFLIVLEGVNDLGGIARRQDATETGRSAMVQHILGAYEQIVMRARTHGIKVFGATILPYVGSDYYHPSAADEAARQAVNNWIRTPGHFDAVIDFDQITRDPNHPDRLRPAYDCGDHLHPSPPGYAAMADAIPLSLFSAARH